jgi:uncharacterized iron-regulated protein
MAKTAASETVKSAAKPPPVPAKKAGTSKDAATTKKSAKAATVNKAEKAEKAEKVVKAVKTVAKANPDGEVKEKAKKPKLVRDSFTMPEKEYAVLGEVKKACLKAGIEVKKSELLRVGVALIRQLETAKLKEILAGLPTLKAGRPKK